MTNTTAPKMINFRHELEVDNKKLAKKLRRQARDMMRAHFDYDGIRFELSNLRATGVSVKAPTVEESYDLFAPANEDVA